MSKRLIASTLAAVLLCAPVRAQVVIEEILVRVNGDILTKTELEARQVAVLRNRPEFANANPESEALRRAIAEITPSVVLDAVDELLLIQRGREMGLALGDEQFRSVVENIRKSNNLEDEARFLAALQQEGMTMADLRVSLERQMLVSEVMRTEVMAKVGVTEEEARAYYEANRARFTTTAEITLREILVEVPTIGQNINVAQDDTARAEAEQVRSRLVAGEPFAQLAAEFSDAPSKANGGLIGPISYSELAPALQKLLDGMQVGDLTPVQRTTRGYQILKLETRTDARVRPFEDARADVTNAVGEQKLATERLRYLELLRSQASITWRNEELRKAYDQALAARQKALMG